MAHPVVDGVEADEERSGGGARTPREPPFVSRLEEIPRLFPLRDPLADVHPKSRETRLVLIALNSISEFVALLDFGEIGARRTGDLALRDDNEQAGGESDGRRDFTAR